MTIWTLAEENMLRSMYQTHSNKEIGWHMGRSRNAVSVKLAKMKLRRQNERCGDKTMTVRLSDTMRAALQDDANRKRITIGSIVRAIVAEHYGLEGERIVAVRGGKRQGAGRPSIVNKSPSMPFVPIGRD